MRLIDADALKEVLKDPPIYASLGGMTMEGVFMLIDNEAPTVDAVPVIRCMDCQYWDKDTLRHNSNDVAEWDECECEMLARRDGWNEIDRYCCEMHFCADAERRDDEL